MEPNLPSFQCIKLYVQYLASQPHKPMFILLILMMDQISSDLNGVGIKLNTTLPKIVYNATKTWIMQELLI